MYQIIWVSQIIVAVPIVVFRCQDCWLKCIIRSLFLTFKAQCLVEIHCNKKPVDNLLTSGVLRELLGDFTYFFGSPFPVRWPKLFFGHSERDVHSDHTIRLPPNIFLRQFHVVTPD